MIALFYKKYGKIFFGCSALVMSLALFAGEEDRRNPLSGLYLDPLQTISPDELLQLDSEKRIPIDEDSGIAFKEVPNVIGVPGTEETGPKSIETKIRETDGLLKRYYGQFIEERRIWEDREKGNIYNSRSDQNDIRLLLWQTTHKNAETFIVRDSPILFELHVRAAKLYAEQGKTAPALRHYLAAFRYHPLDQTEIMYREGEWQREDYKLVHKDSVKDHRLAWQNEKTAEKEWLDSKDKLHLALAAMAKNNRPVSEIRSEESRLGQTVSAKEKTFKDAEKAYLDSVNTRYAKYLIEKQKSNATTLYEMAAVIKKIEDVNKERLKIINKLGTAGKGIYILFDYKRNVDFFAYELLLEKAYSCWQENPLVIFDIAEQYRRDSQKAKAIDFYEKYLNLLKNENFPTEEEKVKLISTKLRLATLNADIKRKVIAGNYYEKFFQASPDNKEKTRVSYEMGVFFATHIGDLKKASEYFSYWLERNSKDWNPALNVDTNFDNLEAISFFHLARLDKQNRRSEAEISKLNLALNLWKKIETQYIAAESEVVTLRSDKQKIKRDLLVTTQDDALSKYRLLEIKIEDAEARVRVIKTKLDTIPVLKVFFRLAVLAEGNRDFDRAITYYNSVIELGGEVEIAAALKEKHRVEKIITNGVVLPPFTESI